MQQKHAIKWVNDKVVAIEINGVHYSSLDQIIDPGERAEVERMLAQPQQMRQEFREMERRSNQFTRVISTVFLTIGGLLLVIAVILAINTWRTLAQESAAPGRIIDLVARRDQEGKEFYFPVVGFTLPDGSHKTVQLSQGSWPPAYEQGEAVTILYDPAHPLGARIKSVSSAVSMWLPSLIAGFVGALFAGIGLAQRWFTRMDALTTR